MALEANGQKYGMFNYSENGKNIHRRFHQMKLQAPDGRVFFIDGDKLPIEVGLLSGPAYRGAHVLEVLLSPDKAKGTPLLPLANGWICKRDALFLVLGFFFFELITALAEGVSIALT